MVIDLYDAINEGTYQGITVTKNADRSVTVTGEPDVASVRITSFVPLNVPNGSELTAENNQMTALNIMATNKADGIVEYWPLGSTPRIVDNDTYTYQIYGQVKKSAFVSPVTFYPEAHVDLQAAYSHKLIARRRLLMGGGQKYLFVNYIQTSTEEGANKGTYLHLTDVAGRSTYGYEFEMEYKYDGYSHYFMGNSESNLHFYLQLDNGSYSSTKTKFKVKSSDKFFGYGPNWIQGEWRKAKFTITNGVASYTSTQMGSSTCDFSNLIASNISQRSLAILGVRRYNSYGNFQDFLTCPNARLYYFKVFDTGGNLLRSLKPCVRLADGAVGMYDEITGQFYGNAGTGSFLYA